MIDNLQKKWYAVQTLSGIEQHVARSLREHIKLHAMEDFFGKIIVPTEEVIEIKGGKRKKSERKFFPGYVLIQMIMTQKSWHFVRKIPKIISFVGGKMDNPSSINEKEINLIIDRLQKAGDKPRPKILFEPGELVRVNSGPFSDFNGIVEEVDYERNRLKVSVLIFGRSTPVELNFSQVEKG